tara:strand:+ start:38619 stop:40850 length:2232 start_codon:yes stop_codon:yes gene_type:complete
MSATKNKMKPPYPTFGEAFQVLAGAFDTKQADPSVRKELDRLARQGDFDWSLHRRVIKELLIDPIGKYDADLAKSLDRFVEQIRAEYISLIMKVPLDTMTRNDTLKLLIENFFVNYAASFFTGLKDRFSGPDLNDLFSAGSNPVEVVFKWSEQKLGIDIAKTAYPDEKSKRDDIGRWCSGKTPPNFFGSIIPLKRLLRENCNAEEADIDQFGKWLLVARALVWLEKESHKAGLGSLRAVLHGDLQRNGKRDDITVILQNANNQISKRFSELSRYGLELLHHDLSRNTEKQTGIKSFSRSKLEKFQRQLKKQIPDGRADYMATWCEARWAVLSGAMDRSLELYEQAAEQALYRAGESQKTVLEEALALAAHLEKKPVLKRLKHRALALGLFSSSSKNDEVIEDWEVEQLAGTFGMFFPEAGRFPEAPPDNIEMLQPFKILDWTQAEKAVPNLKHPDRVISLPFLGGGRIRRPQLIMFTFLGKLDAVEALLNAGADVNKFDYQDKSALLIALQHAEDTGDHSILDAIMRHPHKIKTLNQLSHTIRLSPLYQAVLLGDPEVVSLLLKMGARVDHFAGYPDQTPLTCCINHRLFLYTKRGQEAYLNPSFNRPVDREFSRRYAGPIAGPMGDRLPVVANMHPRHAYIHRAGYKSSLEKVTSLPRDNFIKIARLLLEHGANPNLAHAEPGPGRTPLMCAAETDAADVFEIMVDHGGNPFLEDNQGNNCLKIAMGFRSANVIQWLKEYAN